MVPIYISTTQYFCGAVWKPQTPASRSSCLQVPPPRWAGSECTAGAEGSSSACSGAPNDDTALSGRRSRQRAGPDVTSALGSSGAALTEIRRKFGPETVCPPCNTYSTNALPGIGRRGCPCARASSGQSPLARYPVITAHNVFGVKVCT